MLNTAEFPAGTSFADAIGALKTILQDAGFRVLAEVSTSEILRGAGYAADDLHQIFFFRPDYLSEILVAHPEALAAIPMKAVLRAGGAVEFSAIPELPTLPEITNALQATRAEMRREIERGGPISES
jgi:uncharacterized protein (DUF302 family)